MATKSPVFSANPSWSKAQSAGFYRVQEALPIALSYLADEIPVLDNITDKQLVDEVGVLKQAKKTIEGAEKAHVERLKIRMNSKPLPKKDGEEQKFGVKSLRGEAYEAAFRGSTRTILNQEACKGIIEELTEQGIHIKRLVAAIKSGQIPIPDNVMLGTIPIEDGQKGTVPETNASDFFNTSGGSALYVEPIA